jgi:galactokinase
VCASDVFRLTRKRIGIRSSIIGEEVFRMANGRKLPTEIIQFESFLSKPNSDPTGFAGFFNSGEIVVTRVPARLDVMGGISDYSGSNVCEGVLGRGMVIALQPRTDRTLRIRTMQAHHRSLPIETRIPLDYFDMGEGFVSYEQVRALCKANPLSSWAAYIGGSIFTLLKEESVHLPFGFSLLLLSGVPMNVGIGSSASTEIATLYCLQSYLRLNITESRLAQLGQLAENLVVGAPCGIMDQITVTSGRQGKLTHILCRPGSIMGEVDIPHGTAFVGINSMVKHSVSGAEYGDVRIGAFMGKRIINQIRVKNGEKPLQYLTELTVDSFEKDYRDAIPESMIGSEFLARYESHDDPITEVQPDAKYRILGPTLHPVYENQRVLKFMDHLKAATNEKNEDELLAAGEYMCGSHESYRDNCLLSVPEVDFIVDAVRARGHENGLFGAKITGGGSGGTVAVFGRKDALAREIPAIAREYKRLTGLDPDIFDGTSPGAIEFGSFRYTFGPTGWIRSI